MAFLCKNLLEHIWKILQSFHSIFQILDFQSVQHFKIGGGEVEGCISF